MLFRRVILSNVEIRVKRGSNDVYIVRDLGGKVRLRLRFAQNDTGGADADGEGIVKKREVKRLPLSYVNIQTTPLFAGALRDTGSALHS